MLEENQASDKLYFIISGEVEIFKSISCESDQYLDGLQGDDQLKIKYNSLQASKEKLAEEAVFFRKNGKLLNSHGKEEDKINFNDYLKKKNNKNKKRLGLLKLQQGEIIGAEELWMDSPVTFTGAKCVGKRVEVLELSFEDYKQKIKNDQCAAQIKQIATSRLEFINNRLIKLEKIEAKLMKTKKQERIMQTLENQTG